MPPRPRADRWIPPGRSVCSSLYPSTLPLASRHPPNAVSFISAGARTETVTDPIFFRRTGTQTRPVTVLSRISSSHSDVVFLDRDPVRVASERDARDECYAHRVAPQTKVPSAV